MSTRSARINILVSPEEKAAIEAMAAGRELSVSEHMREAALEYSHEFDENNLTEEQKAEMLMLSEQVSDMVDRLEVKLDKSHEEHLRWRNELNALRRQHGHQEI